MLQFILGHLFHKLSVFDLLDELPPCFLQLRQGGILRGQSRFPFLPGARGGPQCCSRFLHRTEGLFQSPSRLRGELAQLLS